MKRQRLRERLNDGKDEIVDAVDNAEELDKDEAEFDRLAALSDLEYEKERKPAAQRIGGGIRVSVLDAERAKRRAAQAPPDEHAIVLIAPKPSHQAVDGAETLDKIVAELQRYVILSDEAARAIALWIVFTYMLEI